MDGDEAYLLDRSTNRRFPLRGGTLLVGRGAETQLQINDDFLSRRHFALTRGPQGWLIRDLASSNGTSVNGEKLRTGQVRLLQPGDCIQAGRSQWTLQRAVPTPRIALPLPPKPPAPAAQPARAAGVAPWQWIASAFLALGALLGAICVFLPWVRIDARLVAENLPGGQLAQEFIDGLKALLGLEVAVPLLDQPLSFPISGSAIHAELLFVPLALIVVLLLLDLGLKLGRSSLPGVGYLAIVILPGAMLLMEWRSSMRELGRPVLFGVSLLDVLQGVTQAGASFVDIHPTALVGIYVAVAASLLLAVGGFLRLVMPLAQGSR